MQIGQRKDWAGGPGRRGGWVGCKDVWKSGTGCTEGGWVVSAHARAPSKAEQVPHAGLGTRHVPPSTPAVVVLLRYHTVLGNWRQ